MPMMFLYLKLSTSSDKLIFAYQRSFLLQLSNVIISVNDKNNRKKLIRQPLGDFLIAGFLLGDTDFDVVDSAGFFAPFLVESQAGVVEPDGAVAGDGGDGADAAYSADVWNVEMLEVVFVVIDVDLVHINDRLQLGRGDQFIGQ